MLDASSLKENKACSAKGWNLPVSLERTWMSQVSSPPLRDKISHYNGIEEISAYYILLLEKNQQLLALIKGEVTGHET